MSGRWGWVGFAVLAGLFAATEVFSVHLHFSRNSHSFSLFEIPLALGLFFVPGLALVAAHALGSGMALALHRHQPPMKLVSTWRSFVIADQVAITVFRAVAGRPGGFTVAATSGAAAAALAASLLSAALVILVISVAEGSWRDRRLVSSLGFGSVSALISTSLGLIAVEVLTSHPEASWLLLVPTVGLYLANHAYTRQRRRHQGLEFLHDSTQLLHQSPELETALVQLVGHARDAFRASFAEFVYVPADTEHIVDVIAGRAEVTTASRLVKGSDLEPLMDYVAGSVTPLLIQRGHSPAELVAYLDAHDLSDAVIAPLRGEIRACGVLVIGNRHGDVARFDRDDLVLLATLAANIATALENGRLEQSLDQLRQLERKLTHQATHDGLTELANRTLFTQQVATALTDADKADACVAVLFIDLDDFKTVNDSLGHAAGTSSSSCSVAACAPLSPRPLRQPASAATSSPSCSPRSTTSPRSRPSPTDSSSPSGRRCPSWVDSSPCVPASVPRCRRPASEPPRCSETPTPPCTPPKAGARTASRCSNPRSTPPPFTGTTSPSRWTGRSEIGSSSSTTSRSCGSPTAPS